MDPVVFQEVRDEGRGLGYVEGPSGCLALELNARLLNHLVIRLQGMRGDFVKTEAAVIVATIQ
eukprot:scaffold70363_cov44-Prasinocladus_malaysianus.AAC.1